MLALHLDQNNSISKGSQIITENQRKIDNAYKLFNEQKECVKLGRLCYDLEYNKLILAQRRHIKLNNAGAYNEFKRQNKSK